MSWWQQPLVGFDLETTGTDPAVDRIVTAALVDTVGARRLSATGWLLDPGVPIPAEARRSTASATTSPAARAARPRRRWRR